MVIADTAGRLHTKSNLMDELTKVRRIVDKRLPGAQPETLFVLDATTGQNGLAQARAFHEAVGLTGIVLTKLDSTAKGGIVFAIEDGLKVPVRFVGVGEGVNDLLPFDPTAFVEALFAEPLRRRPADPARPRTPPRRASRCPSTAGRAAAGPATSTGSPPRAAPPSGARKAVARKPDHLGQQSGPDRGCQLGRRRSDLERRRDPAQLPIGDQRLADRRLGDVVDGDGRVGDQLLAQEERDRDQRASRPARAG